MAALVVAAVRIIPAYAGSTSTVPIALMATADHPRIRGEHGGTGIAQGADNGSSPHTRGAPSPGILERLADGIIPAYAGSTTPTAGIHCRRADHPRIRGEHRSEPQLRRKDGGSSPHTRGARTPTLPRQGYAGIIPAYAGSTRRRAPCWPSTADHPRIRGEHFISRASMARTMGSSPHTRGALLHSRVDAGDRGIIPAYAGSTDFLGDALAAIGGSSPHTRGAPTSCRSSRSRLRIIPAYAGSTWGCTWFGMVTTDHPRIRGEHYGSEIVVVEGLGSSPHTRGALVAEDDSGLPGRIIPAYAGSTSRRCCDSCHIPDHPRIRGEHVRKCSSIRSGAGSSPHTRGARGAPLLLGCVDGIIPAYAGSTNHLLLSLRAGEDHPRIRGEHRVETTGAYTVTGSSPHTRGARECCESNVAGGGIIPAYAGSTE